MNKQKSNDDKNNKNQTIDKDKLLEDALKKAVNTKPISNKELKKNTDNTKKK